jgi:hypothetical protein
MNRLPMIESQTPWDCRFTRLASPSRRRSVRHEGHAIPEPVWVCVRNGSRRHVADEECESCEHWEPNAID